MSVAVYFGNMSVSKMANTLRINLNAEDKNWLEKHHQESANNIRNDEFHIFEYPFRAKVGKDIIDEFISRLQKYDYSNAERAMSVQEADCKENENETN